MPFDEEEELEVSSPKKSGLKKASSQKSIFDEIPKKPTQQDFDKKVKNSQERVSGHRTKGIELSKKYIGLLKDKTLKQNKSLFIKEMEQEVISSMVQLAIDINNDSSEQEGMGSLSWIILLLKSNLSQNDRINELEYKLSVLENKLNIKNNTKESVPLDTIKNNE